MHNVPFILPQLFEPTNNDLRFIDPVRQRQDRPRVLEGGIVFEENPLVKFP
jgi:hypothetical protein